MHIDRYLYGKGSDLMDKNYGQYSIVFKALSDDTRIKILDMLSKGELCACNILEEFDITQPTLSYHMKILCESGLVESRKEGIWMRYSIKNETLLLLKNLFDEFEANIIK